MNDTTQLHDGISTRGWLNLAMGVLGLAGIMALLVGLARIPALGPYVPPLYFKVALVGHVDLLLVVWYLVMPVLLWRHLGLLGGKWERLSFGIIAAGTLAVVAPSVAGWGEPVMANYIPFLVHPAFVAGLAVFLAGIGMAALQAAGGLRAASPLARAGALGAVCVLGSLAAMMIVAWRIAAQGDVVSKDNLARIFWVGGHLQQFAHTALMLTAVGVLLKERGCRESDLRRFLSIIHLYPLGVLIGVAAGAVLEPEALLKSPLMTDLKSWGVGIPTVLAVLLSLPMWRRERGVRSVAGRAAHASVVSAMLLLIAGGWIAIFYGLGRQTTLIPGHYHAVLTAVAVAFMGLTYLVLDREGVRLPGPRWTVLQPYFYGLGTLALVAGMAWAGTHGAPRKTPCVACAKDAAMFVAMNLWGLGALLSTAGGGAYFILAGLAIYRWTATPAAKPGSLQSGAGEVADESVQRI